MHQNIHVYARDREAGKKRIADMKVKQGLSDAAVKKLFKELDDQCFGSRGKTPATRMARSVLQFLVDPLHFKNNIGVLTWKVVTCTFLV